MRLEVIDIEKLRSNSGQIEGLPAVSLTTEEIQIFVESKRPSLRGKDYKIAF